MLGDKLANGGHEINRNIHRSVCRRLERSLVLSNGLLVALCLIVLKDPPDAGFIPAGRELALFPHSIELANDPGVQLPSLSNLTLNDTNGEENPKKDHQWRYCFRGDLEP